MLFQAWQSNEHYECNQLLVSTSKHYEFKVPWYLRWSDGESQSRDAKLKITSLSTHIKELQKLLEEKNAKIEQLEQKKNGLADVEGIRIAPGW